MTNHHCFDTVHCHCAECKGKFAGCNPKSIELDDGKHVIGIFNLHLANGFAVDEDLHSCVLTHSTDATSTIQDQHCSC